MYMNTYNIHVYIHIYAPCQGWQKPAKKLLAAGFKWLKLAGKKSWWQKGAKTKMSLTYADIIMNCYPPVIHKLYTC